MSDRIVLVSLTVSLDHIHSLILSIDIRRCVLMPVYVDSLRHLRGWFMMLSIFKLVQETRWYDWISIHFFPVLHLFFFCYLVLVSWVLLLLLLGLLLLMIPRHYLLNRVHSSLLLLLRFIILRDARCYHVAWGHLIDGLLVWSTLPWSTCFRVILR